MTVAEQFGRNLAEARGWAGLSQTELGEQLSLRYQQIGKLERGEQLPRLDQIVRLAEVLGLQVRDLLFEIE
jgi:ribosome-binding protein aMBF1 (putative translation factor)